MDYGDRDDPPGSASIPGMAEPRVAFFEWEEARVAEGLPADALRRIAQQVLGDPIEATKLVHAIVPKTSLNRRDRLTQAQSEQTERLGRLFHLACRAFGDQDDARLFMRRAHPELGNRRPIDAILTELGGRAVERILDGLVYGLPV